MRTLFFICLLGLLPACGGGGEEGPIDPILTPEGRLCGRAYGSFVDSVEEALNVGGVMEKDRPEMPDKAAYVEKCMAAAFTEDQAKCLDPKWAAMNDDCEELLEPKKDQVKELNDMFTAAFDAEAKPEGEEGAEGEGAEGEGAEGEEAEGDGAEGDAGDAVKDALGD